MRRKNIALAIAVLLGSLCLVSCSNPEKDIIGRWKEVDGTDTIVFSKDGTVNGVSMATAFGGKYNFTEDKRLWIQTTLYYGHFQVKVSGNELTLTDENGISTKYRREK